MDATHNNRKTHVIAVGNQKGGVSKTTNTVHQAVALSKMGKKVLIFDLDMNYGATKSFGIEPEAFLGTYEVLVGGEAPLDVVVHNGDEGVEMPDNIHIIPSKRKLETINEVLAQTNKFVAYQDILLEPIASLRGHYDYVLLDTAPNATAPTVAAYKTADFFMLSAVPEPFAISGLNDALRDIQAVQQHGNPNLQLLGVVLSRIDKRTNLANKLMNYVDEQFTTPQGWQLKFHTDISQCTYIPTAQDSGTTIFSTHPGHKVCEQYMKLAEEIDQRVRFFTGEVEEWPGPMVGDAKDDQGGTPEPVIVMTEPPAPAQQPQSEGEGVVNG